MKRIHKRKQTHLGYSHMEHNSPIRGIRNNDIIIPDLVQQNMIFLRLEQMIIHSKHGFHNKFPPMQLAVFLTIGFPKSFVNVVIMFRHTMRERNIHFDRNSKLINKNSCIYSCLVKENTRRMKKTINRWSYLLWIFLEYFII